jgi:hypothetical protein
MSSKAIPKMYLIIVLAFLLSTGGDAKADFTFGTPTNLGPTVNSSRSDGLPRITADGLELYFNSNRSGGYGDYDLWVATRGKIDDDWGEPMNLGSTINTSTADACPSISADGLTLFFASSRPGGYGNSDLYVTTRQTTDDPFGPPVNLGPTVNSSSLDSGPCISIDGLSLFFMSNRPGGSGGDNVWLTTRETINGEWSAPVNLGPNVNGSGLAGFPYISDDGLLLFFASIRAGGYGAVDIWLAKWNTKDDTWGAPVNLGPVINSSRDELSVCISGNGSTLFFSSRRSGGVGDQDIWQAPIIPTVDFDDDGNVDALDLCIMVDHWDEDYPLCDIGPMPWGDGIVDVQDLTVLSDHFLEDYPLKAYWKLDEIEGDNAYDSVGDHDGTLNGNPLWQPEYGAVEGSLMLDGIDDYADTPFILDPAKGSFSVFAWINCWTPGQVIISQEGDLGGTWLGTNPLDGKLMTGFSDSYFGALVSETIITDIQWHHVGFVYDTDTFHRRLYVDGILEAEDTTAISGVSSDEGLHIGASKDLDAGTFFSGFIDDVRIYNQALSAKEITALTQ